MADEHETTAHLVYQLAADLAKIMSNKLHGQVARAVRPVANGQLEHFRANFAVHILQLSARVTAWESVSQLIPL